MITQRIDVGQLGVEKAGGGTSGKHAKLGKLIVYDEGLKMLDLVVAANLGVWWRVWERTSFSSFSEMEGRRDGNGNGNGIGNGTGMGNGNGA